MYRTCAILALAAGLLAACGRGQETAGSETTSSTVAPASEAPAAETAQPAAPPSPEVQKLLATLPAPYNTGDVEHGHVVFARCQVCHTATEGGPDMIGPNLWGVFGRKVASKPGYAYSDALKAKDWTWDASHLNAWLENPRAVAPGTKMSFAGLADPKDRIDVIAYLKTATAKQP
jgi:cytochrome c